MSKVQFTEEEREYIQHLFNIDLDKDDIPGAVVRSVDESAFFGSKLDQKLLEKFKQLGLAKDELYET